MTELSLALLGPPVVLRDGLPVTFDTRKAIALLAVLGVTGREHSREQLADLLWPEADSAKGRASLRRTLSVTAAAMGAGLTRALPRSHGTQVRSRWHSPSVASCHTPGSRLVLRRTFTLERLRYGIVTAVKSSRVFFYGDTLR